MQELLDKVIWNALTHDRAAFAEGAGVGGGLARRFDPAIGPLSAVGELTDQAFADLALLVGPDELAVMFLDEVPSPAGWVKVLGDRVVQMVCQAIHRRLHWLTRSPPWAHPTSPRCSS